MCERVFSAEFGHRAGRGLGKLYYTLSKGERKKLKSEYLVVMEFIAAAIDRAYKIEDEEAERR